MLKQLNDVITCIEENLCDGKVIEKAMEKVSVSQLHLKNVFFFLTGMSLNEYVRNRRLSEANRELLDGGKVTDIAFKYGYRSVDGFTRAFKNRCGFLPSDVLKRGECKVFPPFNFTVKIRGGSSMECKIVKKPAFNFVGVSKRVPLQYEGVNEEIVKLAESIRPEQREEMHHLQNMEPFEIVNVSYNSDTDFKEEKGYLTHLIGVLTTESEAGGGLEVKPMKAGTWAVFPNEGEFPSVYQDTMARIYSEWFMTSDYELADALSFSFTKMDRKKQGYAYSEIWIPVVKKIMPNKIAGL